MNTDARRHDVSDESGESSVPSARATAARIIDPFRRHLFTRRRFLAYSGAVGGAALLQRYAGAAARFTPELADYAVPSPGLPSCTLTLRRPQDQINLGYEFYNLTLNKANPSNPYLTPISSSAPSYVVVVFPPQALVEEAVFQPSPAPGSTQSGPDSPLPADGPVQSRLSGPSRLAFYIPSTITQIPFNSQGLLNWNGWVPSIVPWAASSITPNSGSDSATQYNGYPLIRPITAVETQIELPWRLVLSPNETAQWEHSLTPVAGPDGQTELWHTRLGIAVPTGGFTEAPGGKRTVRAVYSNDPGFQTNYNNGQGPNEAQDGVKFPQANNPCGDTTVTDPFQMALYAGDRYDIVSNSSDYRVAPGPLHQPPNGFFPYTPSAVENVNYLMLSSLGGFVDLDANWNNENSNLVEWRHKATLGRDHYVKVVYRGYLMPTGHPAVLIEETRREFQFSDTNHTYGAYLRKRIFIMVRQPVKEYGAGGAVGSANNQRQWPFRQIELTTHITPDLDPIINYTKNTTASTDPATPPPASCGGSYTGPHQAYQAPFVPTVTGPTNQPVPFQWHIRGTDWGGVTHDFTMGMVFVFYTDAMNIGDPQTNGQPNITAISQQYNNLSTTSPDPGNTWINTPDDIKKSDLLGQKVNFAEVTRPNETAFSTGLMTWGVEPPQSGVVSDSNDIQTFISNDQPQFYPVMRWASITMSALESAHGGAPLGGQLVAISGSETKSSYNPTPTLNQFNLPEPSTGYLMHGFSPSNGPASFLTLVDDTGTSLEAGTADPNYTGAVGTTLGFASNNSGGSLTPNLSLSGISKTTGLMAGSLSDIMSGNGIDFQKFFQGADPTILGAIKLWSILGPVADMAGAGSSQAMTILQQEIPSTNPGMPPSGPGIPSVPSVPQIPGLPAAPSVPQAIDITFDWKPPLQAALVFNPHPDAAADIHGLIHTSLTNPAGSTSTINGSLTNFDIDLFPDFSLITIVFNELSFTQANAQKPQINVDIQSVNFDGPLNFVQTLEQYLSSLGLGGLTIDVSPTGVEADLTVALPDISIGIFNLSNLSFSGSVSIPFTNNPARFRFSFCSQDNPFDLNVMFLGGGGFFAIALGLDGLEQVQASLEFGAQVSMNLGIASGSIEVYAGIYFSLTENPTMSGGTQTDIDLTGYVRFGGEVSVLGIISVSITCNLSLSYDSAANTMTGKAYISISVSLFCFSVSASIAVEKTFGGGGDPTFQQAIPTQNVWNSYTSAFAPIGAN